MLKLIIWKIIKLNRKIYFHNHFLDLNDDVQIGKKVRLLVKPTNISLAKNLIGEISLSNQIVANIQSLENGQLLTSVILEINDTILESIITVDSSKRMNLQIGEVVTILIKASNLSIEEVINDWNFKKSRAWTFFIIF